MASHIGTALNVTLFGQSHSAAIGCVIEGLPAGFALDQKLLASFMARRAPGAAAWSTSRREADEVHIVSGLNAQGTTCGAPLACLIENKNVRSSDYDAIAHIPRPGHADLVAHSKWHGHNDVRGGGHFSGRLTAPLVAAGAIVMQILSTRGVRVGAHLLQVGSARDLALSTRALDADASRKLAAQLDALSDGRSFPVIDQKAGLAMQHEIDAARAEGDSVGGLVECVACGLPRGIGGPAFDGIESAIARILFGIPAVKGVEFGAGFEVVGMRGSANNDEYALDAHSTVQPTKNDAGGNLGGITTGAPLVVRAAIKPTPSIASVQHSVELAANTNEELRIAGRHDPCIAPRAVPVVEAAVALALLDCWLAFPPDDVIEARP